MIQRNFIVRYICFWPHCPVRARLHGLFSVTSMFLYIVYFLVDPDPLNEGIVSLLFSADLLNKTNES